MSAQHLVPAGPAEPTRIERFQSLQPGRYWRARQDIPDEGIDAGEVLLLQSLRYAEDRPHTVILRPHPSKIGRQTYLTIPQKNGKAKEVWFRYSEHRFRVPDFLDKFEFEPDHERVRRTEVAQIQGRISELQSELVEAQHDPARMAGYIEQGLREKGGPENDDGDGEAPVGKRTARRTAARAAKTPAAKTPAVPTSQTSDLVSVSRGSLTGALESGVSPERIQALRQVAQREHRIATLKAQWIKEKTGEIAQTLSELTPFFEEQAAAALAQTEDVRNYVDKLMQGIGSLDLYVGKGVEVETIVEGAPASEDLPLTIVQRKLVMCEELALWADVGADFDFAHEGRFFEALRENESLVRQIFPAERCVLVMATTRYDIDYGDKWDNAARNRENKKVFLLVRNGANIHRVFSPVESHLGAARLFPPADEQDQIFRGIDGREIKFEDLAYTDKLADHEAHALHYKRFLLLICGLDHRLKLFGTFYPGHASFEFVSLEFQAAHLHFLCDEGRSVLGEDLQPLREWIAEKNRYLRSGSRVLCRWHTLMNPVTAPGACFCDSSQRGFDRRYTSDHTVELAIAYRDGESICVDTQVSGYSYSTHKDRRFNCKVDLTAYRPDYEEGLAYLCLDAVRPEEIAAYMASRATRCDHVYYIRFFKHALAHLEAERAAEAPAREALLEALETAKLACGKAALELIDQAVIAWRAANNGKALPGPDHQGGAAWRALLDQMFVLARSGNRLLEETESLAREHGLAPLRLVLSGRAKPVLYAAPRDSERDDRLEPHAWVHRLTLERGKRALKVKSDRWATLPALAAGETTLKEWAGVEDWTEHPSAFRSLAHKRECLARTERFADLLAPFAAPLSRERYRALLETWRALRREALRNSHYVRNPWFVVPFGALRKRGRELASIRYLCVGTSTPHALLYRLAPSEPEANALREEFLGQYQNRERAAERFQSDVAEYRTFTLLELSPAHFAHVRDGFFGAHKGNGFPSIEGRPEADPRLATWFEAFCEQLPEDVSMHLADGVLDARGALTLDTLLGIKLPADYAPVQLLELTCQARGGRPAPAYTHWFDIVPEAADADECLPQGSSYSSDLERFTSPAAARDRVAEKVAEALTEGATLVSAKDLPDAPSPPTGVERWYLVPKALATDALVPPQPARSNT